MSIDRTLCMLAAAAMLSLAPSVAQAEYAISHPAKTTIGAPKNNIIPSLAVLNAKGASLKDDTLTLTGVSPNSIVFADRPIHAAGHVLTAHFIREWDEGFDSFAKNPPNATVSVLAKEGDAVQDAVVVLKSPTLEGDTLTFSVDVLEGELKDADGAAALFIDRFAVHARGPHGGHFSAYGGGPRPWRGAWYGRPGVALGAGLAAGTLLAGSNPYLYGPPPPCGYPPYPPCPLY